MLIESEQIPIYNWNAGWGHAGLCWTSHVSSARCEISFENYIFHLRPLME